MGMPPVDRAEVARRMTWVPATTSERQRQHAMAHRVVLEAAGDLAELLPECREKSLAITALEEALMWANKAIALQREPEDDANITHQIPEVPHG